MEVVAPLENDPILSVRSIRSFRHLELQNPSIISDFRHRSRMVQQFRNGGTEEEEEEERRNGGGLQLISSNPMKILCDTAIQSYTQ